MKVTSRYAMEAYGASPVQEEALRARKTHSIDEQTRIAENSEEKLVLMNLAMNKNLYEEVVQALYDRDHKDVTRRLNSLGYEKKNWFEKIID